MRTGGPGIVVAIVLAGCLVFPAGPPSGSLALPPLVGALETVTLDYDFGAVRVPDPLVAGEYYAPLRGVLHAPAVGTGPFPVVLLMHGRHGTCAYPVFGEDRTHLLCEPIATPVDSFRGYDWLAKPLAASGYAVLSVDANIVNDRDELPGAVFLPFAAYDAPVLGPLVGETYWAHVLGPLSERGDRGMGARAEIFLSTLDRLRDLEASGPVGELLSGRIDLSRVGLMGHSRGGEGVVAALAANAERQGADRHSIRAALSLAPSDFLSWTAADAAFLTLLPYCDGDVWNLWGAAIYDDSRDLARASPASLTQIVHAGANHNAYNTVWTSDDAWWMEDDPVCGASLAEGGSRLSEEEQRAGGLLVMAGFFRSELGGEEAFAPLLDGRESPQSACPPAAPDCLRASHHPPEGKRAVLFSGDTLAPAWADGFDAAEACAPRDCPAMFLVGNATAMHLAWTAPATLRVPIEASARDSREFDAVTVRIAVNGNRTENPAGEAKDIRLVLRDGAGRSAEALLSDFAPPLVPPAGDEGYGGREVLEMVRVPLAAFASVDRSDLRSIELAVAGMGSIEIADLMLQ